MNKTIQKIGRILWFTAISGSLFCYFRYPESFRAEALASSLALYHEQALLMYFLISVGRGFFLIPSTPFVLAGVLLFPNHLFWVFFISMVGVLFGSSVVYFFSERLGFGEVLRTKHEKLYLKIERKMKRYGVPIVLLWSFFPLVPTDLICCIAGSIKMSFQKFFLAVLLGECFLILGYMYTGKALFSWLFLS